MLKQIKLTHSLLTMSNIKITLRLILLQGTFKITIRIIKANVKTNLNYLNAPFSSKIEQDFQYFNWRLQIFQLKS